MENAPALSHSISLPCPSCGSQLSWSASAQQLACGHCGYLEKIDRSKDKVIEQSLAEAASQAKSYVPEELSKKVFDCKNCGSKFMVETDQVKVNCGFCGSDNVNTEAFQHRFIQPVGIVPFYISREESEKKFREWIAKGWFHPDNLKKLAFLDHLHGIYLPFWTYDAQTDSEWEGEAGHYYYETAWVNVNGKRQQQQVRKIRWEYRQGCLGHFFDDVLVVASGGLPQETVEKIVPYKLEEIVNFDPRFTVGWEAEVYNLEVDKGYQVADGIMNDRIRQMCSAQLGGDTQRNLRISSHKSAQTFKHILLPVWICTYNYKEKIYRFTINGQTGRMEGKKPLSTLKIVLTVLLALLVIGAIVIIVQSNK